MSNNKIARKIIITSAVDLIVGQDNTFPGTFSSICERLEFKHGSITTQERTKVKQMLPRFFGVTGYVHKLLQNAVGKKQKLADEITFLIMDFRGQDVIEIFTGNQRSLGTQVKTLFDGGNDKVILRVKPQPEDFYFHLNKNPFEKVLEEQFLNFYVCVNGRIVYLTVNQKPDINEIWRAVCQNNPSQQVQENLTVWNNFVKENNKLDTEFIDINVKFNDPNKSLAQTITNICEKNYMKVVDFKHVHGGKMLFQRTSDKQNKTKRQSRRTHPVTVKKHWDGEKQTKDDLTNLVNEMCGFVLHKHLLTQLKGIKDPFTELKNKTKNCYSSTIKKKTRKLKAKKSMTKKTN